MDPGGDIWMIPAQPYLRNPSLAIWERHPTEGRVHERVHTRTCDTKSPHKEVRKVRKEVRKVRKEAQKVRRREPCEVLPV